MTRRTSQWHLKGRLKENRPFITDISESPFLIGRNSDCHLILSAQTVSRHHAKLTIQQDTLYIEDMNSKNGTFVNEQPVSSRSRIMHSDRIRLGDIEFLVLHETMNANDGNQTILTNSSNVHSNFSKDFSLSERETEVLALLLQGRDQNDIAERLFISAGTAKNHILKIYKKTETHSKVELFRLYQDYMT